MAYFNNQNIHTLPWPSLSPDLSPIEHLWDELDRRLRVRNVPPATPDELVAVLQEDWETIPRQTIQHLIASMPRRCRAVILANGGHTWPVLIFRADNGVPAESKGTKSGQFDWSDTLLSRHYRRLLSYSFDFVNFERSNVT